MFLMLVGRKLTLGVVGLALNLHMVGGYIVRQSFLLELCVCDKRHLGSQARTRPNKLTRATYIGTEPRLDINRLKPHVLTNS